MSFCKFSPGAQKNESTVIDNVFITKYLPSAPDMCVKVYLLGLSKCNSQDVEDNNLTYFAKLLNISEDDVVSCFKYWEDLGLVQVLSTNPVEVRYLPINTACTVIKKFDSNKYADFNLQAQELFGEHQLTQNEYSAFYDLMQDRHMEQNALITLIKYCAENQSFKLRPAYVTTVAKDWARNGILTLAQVEAHIEELGLIDDSLKQLFSAMGSVKKITLEDKAYLNKWKTGLGYDLQTIIYVAKMQKIKKARNSMQMLDAMLNKYYENRLLSIKEIEEYEQNKEQLTTTAININKQLGLYYEDLSKEIDTYILPWINMGFDDATLNLIADNCFKSSIRSLEGLNNIVNKLHKMGIVTTKAYNQYLSDNLAHDSIIKEVLTALNLDRNVIKPDRDYYNTWTNNWGFSHEVILYAASLSAGRSNAFAYLNKVLSNWNESGVKTLDKAKNTALPKEDNSKFIHHNYTKEQISSLISNLDEVEV